MKQFKGIRFGNYLLSADEYCFHLSEVVVVTDEDSKNFGKEYLRNTTYHGSIEQVANKLVKVEALKTVQEKLAFTELVEVFKQRVDDINHHLTRLANANQK